jgi:hypothetical protein
MKFSIEEDFSAQFPSARTRVIIARDFYSEADGKAAVRLEVPGETTDNVNSGNVALCRRSSKS